MRKRNAAGVAATTLLVIASACDPIAFYDAQVLDPDGKPIPAVAVDCYKGKKRLGLQRTDESGCVSDGRIAYELRCTFTKTGYDPIRMKVEPGSNSYQVIMRPRGDSTKGTVNTVEQLPACP